MKWMCAGREAYLVDDLREDEGVERRHLAGLEHNRAARCERRCHLGGNLVLQRHADFLSDGCGNVLRSGFEAVGNLLKITCTDFDRCLRPAIERSLYCGDGGVYILDRPVRDAAHHLLGRRVDDIQRSRAR
jgi:hypothetical protein